MSRCSTNSHRVGSHQDKDPFLHLHPEISMLHRAGSDTINDLRKEKSGGSVTNCLMELTVLNEYDAAVIKVISVGGGGSNTVNRILESFMDGVEFWIANTDIQAMRMSPIYPDNRLQIGQELTRGTGTGAAPVIAGVAKSMCILTVGIVTTPFSFEGRRREVHSQEGITAMRNNVDTLIVIPNEKLFTAVSPNTLTTEIFNFADDILRQGVRWISDIILVPGLVNVDFTDVRAIMENAGSSLRSIETTTGKIRARM